MREHGKCGSDKIDAHIGFGVGEDHLCRAEFYQQKIFEKICKDVKERCHDE